MKERAIVHQRGRDAMFKVWHAADMAKILYTHSNGGSIVCAGTPETVAQCEESHTGYFLKDMLG